MPVTVTHCALNASVPGGVNRLSQVFVLLYEQMSGPDTPPFEPSAREKILRAAMALIGERGADKVTHRLVADAAGVSPGTTTYHFETREDLIREAFELYIEDYRTGLDGALEHHPLTTLRETAKFLAAMTALSPDDLEHARFEYEMVNHARRDEGVLDAVDSWSRLLEVRIGAVLLDLDMPDPLRTANLVMTVCRGTEFDVMTRNAGVEPVQFEARLLAVLLASSV